MGLAREIDLGTPPPAPALGAAAAPVRLTIDDRAVEAAPGTSIVRAAALADIAIPRLCATDALAAFGSCRLCLVEIEGRAGYPAGCTTPVAEGMVVHTRSDKIDALRRGVM